MILITIASEVRAAYHITEILRTIHWLRLFINRTYC